MVSPKQTGPPGIPTEPYVVSFGAAGPHTQDGPDLTTLMGLARVAMQDIQNEHRELGWINWRTWHLGRYSPDGRSRTWMYKNGQIDERIWADTVAGLGDTFDKVSLYSEADRVLHAGAPSLHMHGSKVRTVEATLRTRAPRVDADAERLLGLLRASASGRGIRTGFIHVDNHPTPGEADPYTEWITQNSRLSDDRFEVEVHGYYWAVLLTEGHLERLGGRHRVQRDAPCGRIESIDTPHPPGLLCVLTNSPLELTADLVIAWREFLKPLLRTGYPDGSVVTQPAHLATRPMWLFEGDPIDHDITNTLQRGMAPSAASFPIRSLPAADPDRATFWLYPGHGFDHERDPDLVNAVINAWYLTGERSRLYDTPGHVSWASCATWDIDDDGHRALVWQAELHATDPAKAIDLLTRALQGLMQPVLTWSGPEQRTHLFDHLDIA